MTDYRLLLGIVPSGTNLDFGGVFCFNLFTTLSFDFSTFWMRGILETNVSLVVYSDELGNFGGLP